MFYVTHENRQLECEVAIQKQPRTIAELLKQLVLQRFRQRSEIMKTQDEPE